MPADNQAKIIIDAVITALKLIKASAGYYYTFQASSVQRWDRLRLSSLERPSAIVVKLSEVKTPHAGGETRHKDVTLNVGIRAVLEADPHPELEIPTDVRCERLQDDLEIALATLDWETLKAEWGTQSFNTFHTEDTADPEDGIDVEMAIEYSHLETQTRTPLVL